MASAGFFHGVEVTDVSSGPIPITQIRSGNIALIGVSPVGPTTPTLVSSAVDAAQFGPSIFDGRTIPHALDAILAQGIAQVLVINVYNSASHLTTVATEANTVSAGLAVTLAHIPNTAPVMKDTTGVTTLVAGVDYSWVVGTNKIKIINSTTYGSGISIKATYSWFDISKVVTADVVGATTGGIKTGIAQLDLAYATFNFNPKILIAPGFVTTQAVSDALVAQAYKLRARVLIDAPAGTTIAQAIAGRGPAGAIANWNSSEKRSIGVFPQVYKPDVFGGGADQLFPYSAYLAGVWAATINGKGIQYSPSNNTVKNVSRAELPLSCGIGDPVSDVQNLNAAGIVTLFTGFGKGYRVWGNRNFSFPSSSAVDTFMPVDLVRDVIDESVQVAAYQFSDLPINLAIIDVIKGTVQNFLNTLKGNGAIIDGTISYDPAKNSSALLAQGKVTFDIVFLAPSAAEDIAFNSYIDTTLYNNLTA